MFRLSRGRRIEVATLDVRHAKFAQKPSVTNGIAQECSINRNEKGGSPNSTYP